MKKFFLRLGEALCVLALAAFIIFVSSQDKISTTPFKELAKAVASECDLKELKKRDKLELKDKLSFDAAAFDNVIYYSSDSVMDVRELLIIFSEDKQSLKNAEEKIAAYVSEKQQLFEDYAPKESELISSHVLINKKGYILFYIGQDKEKAASAFSQKL
ncbi:MAG: DUF4358 domain-containing protein [Ruminococcaceae bacterium]|nr:DUF4358 domain-containing protein [Oscillospiraceae bacterium]